VRWLPASQYGEQLTMVGGGRGVWGRALSVEGALQRSCADGPWAMGERGSGWGHSRWPTGRAMTIPRAIESRVSRVNTD
jgi:hypothetical protein